MAWQQNYLCLELKGIESTRLVLSSKARQLVHCHVKLASYPATLVCVKGLATTCTHVATVY